MTFTKGAKDGKHYWLTPAPLMKRLKAEFHFDYDPCPYPLPEGYNGLTAEWGSSSYVNQPFETVIVEGRKKGPTAWARKALAEVEKGKEVVIVFPIDKWVLMLIEAGVEIRNLGDVKWQATEDKGAHAGTGRHIAMFVMNPKAMKLERKRRAKRINYKEPKQ